MAKNTIPLIYIIKTVTYKQINVKYIDEEDFSIYCQFWLAHETCKKKAHRKNKLKKLKKEEKYDFFFKA